MPLDSADVARLFGACRAQVYRWARGLCGRHDDALDLVQEAFLRLVRAQPTLSSERAAAGWLRQVVCNLAVDRRRAQRPELSLDGAPAQGPRAPRASESGDGGRARLRAALLDLSPQQRLVLLLKCYDDKTFAEIAAELQLSPATVKTHYLRALLALRERLAPAGARDGANGQRGVS